MAAWYSVFVQPAAMPPEAASPAAGSGIVLFQPAPRSADAYVPSTVRNSERLFQRVMLSNADACARWQERQETLFVADAAGTVPDETMASRAVTSPVPCS